MPRYRLVRWGNFIAVQMLAGGWNLLLAAWSSTSHTVVNCCTIVYCCVLLWNIVYYCVLLCSSGILYTLVYLCVRSCNIMCNTMSCGEIFVPFTGVYCCLLICTLPCYIMYCYILWWTTMLTIITIVYSWVPFVHSEYYCAPVCTLCILLCTVLYTDCGVCTSV